MIEAAGLGLRTRRGWVYRDVDLAVAPGEVAAVTGPEGSGRTMLLLTLAGRATPSTGELRVGGATSRPDIRRQVTVARATGAVELDPDLTVGDSRREAGLLFYGADLGAAEELIGLDVDSAAVVGDLAADDRALFALALAAASRPAALVLDDVDLNATPAQQHRIWAGLRAVAGTGIAVVASAVDVRQAGTVGTLELRRDSRAAV
jgi:ABC-type multidrug transport system ATPase subunit